MANDGSGSGRNPDGRFQDETVDDILAGILNKDGSFNEEFGELLTKYLGEDAAHVASLRGIDLSSRLDEPRLRQRVEYEAPDDRYGYDGYGYGPERDVDRRIEEKMPEDVRYMYSAAASQAQRPEFTASGGVRYPAMGVGDSEERVVYDAEWEERARQEAARLQRVREDRMLRGDSTYVRSFVAGGRPMRGRSPFIDPLSSDDDFDDNYRGDQRRQNDGNSFFQEGPPVRQARNRAGRQRNTGSAGGRTGSARMMRDGNPGREDVFESFSDSYEKAERSRAAWMQPDEEISSGRRRRSDRRRDQLPRITSTLRDDYDRMSGMMEGEYGPERRERPPEYPEQPELDPMGERFTAAFHRNRPEEPPAEEEPRPDRVDPAELALVQEQRQGLRSTVSEIVNKYDRRSEEEAAARERAEREERERQEAERLARESFLRNLSSEVASALDEEDGFEKLSEDYEDLTDVTDGRYVPETDALKAFAAAHGANVRAPEEEPAQEKKPAQDFSIYLDPITEPEEASEAAPSARETEAETAEAGESPAAGYGETEERGVTGGLPEEGPPRGSAEEPPEELPEEPPEEEAPPEQEPLEEEAPPEQEPPREEEWTPDFSMFMNDIAEPDEAPEDEFLFREISKPGEKDGGPAGSTGDTEAHDGDPAQ